MHLSLYSPIYPLPLTNSPHLVMCSDTRMSQSKPKANDDPLAPAKRTRFRS